MALQQGKENPDSSLTDELEAHDSGVNVEPRPEDTYSLIRSYALKNKLPTINIDSFAQFVQKYAERYSSKYQQLRGYSQNTKAILISHAQILARSNKCSLEYENETPVNLNFSQYYVEVVRKAWQEIEKDKVNPFPNEEGLEITIPPERITPIDIKTDFVNALQTINPQISTLLRLIFPEDIPSLIITTDLLHKKLLEYAVFNIRIYLSSHNNVGYIQQKLLPVLKGNEHALRESIISIVTKPGKAINTLFEPTDFSFRFWAHFANLVIQEFKEKREKLSEEQGYCQAAYLLGLYNAYYRGIVQKESEKQSTIRNLELQLRKPPYAFTLNDFFGLKDRKGIPIIRKDTRDTFIEFIEMRTKSEENANLPEVVKIKTAKREEYYIHRDLIIPLFVKKLYETAQELKEKYIREWETILRKDKRTLPMIDDLEFALDLDRELKDNYPIFDALLDFDLLFLADEETKIGHDMAQELQRCFDEQKSRLRPATEILALKRKGLLKEVKFRLPFWQRITSLRYLIGIFKKLFLGIRHSIEKSERKAVGQPGIKKISHRQGAGRKEVSADLRPDKRHAGSSSAVEQHLAYKKAVLKLKVHFVGTHMTIPEKLTELSEKWNPLFDSVARKNLIEDVNAMIRDFVRSLKKGFRVKPPDVQRIDVLAEELSANRAFASIKRKDYFKQYIEVYIIKLLGER